MANLLKKEKNTGERNAVDNGDSLNFAHLLIDNCPSNSNTNQADEDDDGIGDVCGKRLFLVP